MAQASRPSQKDFEFLEPFNDTRLVENELALTGSIAGVSLSTLLNLGIWWGVCKQRESSPGLQADTNSLVRTKQSWRTLKSIFVYIWLPW